MNRLASALAAVFALVALSHPSAPAQEEKPKESPKEGSKEDPRLVAIGGLAGSSVYYSFVIVGMTADAFAKEVYDADQVKQITDEVCALTKTNAGQLRDVRKMELTDSDAGLVDEILATLEVIQKYARSCSGSSRRESTSPQDCEGDHAGPSRLRPGGFMGRAFDRGRRGGIERATGLRHAEAAVATTAARRREANVR